MRRCRSSTRCCMRTTSRTATKCSVSTILYGNHAHPRSVPVQAATKPRLPTPTLQLQVAFLRWALQPPGYRREWHVGVRVAQTGAQRGDGQGLRRGMYCGGAVLARSWLVRCQAR